MVEVDPSSPMAVDMAEVVERQLACGARSPFRARRAAKCRYSIQVDMPYLVQRQLAFAALSPFRAPRADKSRCSIQVDMAEVVAGGMAAGHGPSARPWPAMADASAWSNAPRRQMSALSHCRWMVAACHLDRWLVAA